MLNENYTTNILESFSKSDTMQCDTSQCYFTSTSPETLYWRHAYAEDCDTKFILSKLLKSDCIKWSDADLDKVNLE